MSRLQQSIAQKRESESNGLSCVSVQAQTPALLIHIWRGESWILPWSHFSGARFTAADDGEQLELTFANHRVLVFGHHLAALLEDLAAFRISCLRDLPAEYRPSREERVPFVSRIEVQMEVVVST
jgi:hypothetical protein